MNSEEKSPQIYPASIKNEFDKELTTLETQKVLPRLWQHDYTLWSDSPEEISNRLGWLDLPDSMQAEIDDIEALVSQVREDGYTAGLVLGMGGSSLAPDVFSKMFGSAAGYLDLHILDSTDPGAVSHFQHNLDLDKALFVVSTKSGGTEETLSFFKYFYNLLVDKFDATEAARHFIAITDPGSKLEKLATDLNFRKVFLNNPNIGGRYSALSHFGLVPAALLGVDLKKFLQIGKQAMQQNDENTPILDSFAAQLGGLIGTAAVHGMDKLTFISDPKVEPFCDWVEQLIAESTGKSGKGILPVIGEQLAADLGAYPNDRVFVIQQNKGSQDLQTTAEGLLALGHPVISYQVDSPYDLSYWMLVWEIATAIAGQILQIHPFNQPNVEAAKVAARGSVKTYRETGKLPAREAQPLTFETLDTLLSTANPGDYIALQAYVTPNAENEKAFRSLQAALRDRYHLAVTFGFGPRFLHSTGQLHKGDGGNGIFLQFTSLPTSDLNIPENPGEAHSFITFGLLKQAQALGDAQALEDAKRRLLTFTLKEPASAAIHPLVERISA
ncbi:glucose-6-phosphate isomerase [bacterium]|nr:glucose-6-phosphate isomerase [bacterium]